MSNAVLRGLSPVPFVFGALGEEPAAAQAPQRSDADAFEAGRQAGQAEHADRLAALTAEVEALRAELDAAADAEAAHQAMCRETADKLSDAWAEGVRSLEPSLAALAIETAEAILEAPLSDSQRGAAERALSEAIDTVAGGPPVTIALHPIDLLRFQETGLAGALDETHPGLRWEADSGLAEGDWFVSTADAAVRRVRLAMVAALRERLGLPALNSTATPL